LDLEKFKIEAKNAQVAIKAVFNKLRKSPQRDLDDTIHQLHDEAFEKIDCLTCANCCKTTSPIFYQKDIERLAKHFRIRPGHVIEKYLHIDEDNDYVLNTTPCPFLGDDNYCNVYDSRPTACREYPHTNRKKVYQLLDLTATNALICPAVFYIFKKLEEKTKN
jgi:Fe-S-cluster containining protein